MTRIAGIDSLPCTVLILLARLPFESALPVSLHALPVRISSRHSHTKPSRPASAVETLPGPSALLPISMQAPSPAVAPHSPPLLLHSTPVFLLCARPGPSDQHSKMTSQRLCRTRMTSAIFPLRVGAPTSPISRAVDLNPLRRALVRLGVLTVSLALVVGTILVLGPIPTHSASLDALKHPNHLRGTGTIIVPRPDRLSMTVFSPPHSTRLVL